jgi:hypothetical protein
MYTGAFCTGIFLFSGKAYTKDLASLLHENVMEACNFTSQRGKGAKTGTTLCSLCVRCETKNSKH